MKFQDLPTSQASSPEDAEQFRLRLESFNTAMAGLVARLTDYENDDVAVTIDAQGVVHRLIFSDRVVRRHSAETLRLSFNEAMVGAREAAGLAFRAAAKDELGVNVPDPAEYTADDMAKLASSAQEALVKLANESRGTPWEVAFEDVLNPSTRPTEFVGSAGSFQVVLGIGGDVISAEADVMQIRGLDNVTVSEEFLAAYQQAMSEITSSMSGGYTNLQQDMQRMLDNIESQAAQIRARISDIEM